MLENKNIFLDFDHEFLYFGKKNDFLVGNDGLGCTCDISIV